MSSANGYSRQRNPLNLEKKHIPILQNDVMGQNVCKDNVNSCVFFITVDI